VRLLGIDGQRAPRRALPRSHRWHPAGAAPASDASCRARLKPRPADGRRADHLSPRSGQEFFVACDSPPNVRSRVCFRVGRMSGLFDTTRHAMRCERCPLGASRPSRVNVRFPESPTFGRQTRTAAASLKLSVSKSR
jgi:hypothetical protein